MHTLRQLLSLSGCIWEFPWCQAVEEKWKKQGWAGEDSSCDKGPARQPPLTLWGALELKRPVRDVSHWAKISSPLCLDQSLYAGHPRKGVTLGEGVVWD